MENFTEIKQIVLERAKQNGACESAYKKAYNSESLPELAQVLKDNFNWGCEHGVITPDLIEQFKTEFAENGIYINCDVNSGYLLASGSATVEAWGSATVEAWDSATVRAWGSATVRAWGSATVEAWGSATVEAWDSAYISCRTTIECKISGQAIIRRTGINTIQFCDDSMKFEKINTPETIEI